MASFCCYCFTSGLNPSQTGLAASRCPCSRVIVAFLERIFNWSTHLRVSFTLSLSGKPVADYSSCFPRDTIPNICSGHALIGSQSSWSSTSRPPSVADFTHSAVFIIIYYSLPLILPPQAKTTGWQYQYKAKLYRAGLVILSDIFSICIFYHIRLFNQTHSGMATDV